MHGSHQLLAGKSVLDEPSCGSQMQCTCYHFYRQNVLLFFVSACVFLNRIVIKKQKIN